MISEPLMCALGLQDGRSVDVVHQPDADFNEQKIAATQVIRSTTVAVK